MQWAFENKKEITHTKEGLTIEGSMGIMFADIAKASVEKHSAGA